MKQQRGLHTQVHNPHQAQRPGTENVGLGRATAPIPPVKWGNGQGHVQTQTPAVSRPSAPIPPVKWGNGQGQPQSVHDAPAQRPTAPIPPVKWGHTSGPVQTRPNTADNANRSSVPIPPVKWRHGQTGKHAVPHERDAGHNELRPPVQWGNQTTRWGEMSVIGHQPLANAAQCKPTYQSEPMNTNRRDSARKMPSLLSNGSADHATTRPKRGGRDGPSGPGSMVTKMNKQQAPASKPRREANAPREIVQPSFTDFVPNVIGRVIGGVGSAVGYVTGGISNRQAPNAAAPPEMPVDVIEKTQETPEPAPMVHAPADDETGEAETTPAVAEQKTKREPVILEQGKRVPHEEVDRYKSVIGSRNKMNMETYRSAHSRYVNYLKVKPTYDEARNQAYAPGQGAGSLDLSDKTSNKRYNNRQGYFPASCAPFTEYTLGRRPGVTGNYRLIEGAGSFRGISKWVGYGITHDSGTRWIQCWDETLQRWFIWDEQEFKNGRNPIKVIAGDVDRLPHIEATDKSYHEAGWTYWHLDKNEKLRSHQVDFQQIPTKKQLATLT